MACPREFLDVFNAMMLESAAIEFEIQNNSYKFWFVILVGNVFKAVKDGDINLAIDTIIMSDILLEKTLLYGTNLTKQHVFVEEFVKLYQDTATCFSEMYPKNIFLQDYFTICSEISKELEKCLSKKIENPNNNKGNKKV